MRFERIVDGRVYYKITWQGKEYTVDVDSDNVEDGMDIICIGDLDPELQEAIKNQPRLGLGEQDE
jgi:hypothetical protein